MEYRPPKPVSSWSDLPEILSLGANYQATWNQISWSQVRNRIPPPPERNSRGRLTWTHPLTIHYHVITPAFDERPYSRVARLARKGWVGLTMGNFSTYEEARILQYVRSLGDAVYTQRVWVDERGDERPGDIGPFASRHRSFYFQTAALRDGLVTLIKSFPPRTLELYVPDDFQKNPHFASAVEGLNWHVFAGEDGNLLTLPADIDNASFMALKLFVACPAPDLSA